MPQGVHADSPIPLPMGIWGAHRASAHLIASTRVPVFVQALKVAARIPADLDLTLAQVGARLVAVHVLDATPLTMLSCEGGRVRARRYTCNDVVLLRFTVRPGGEYVGLPRERLRRQSVYVQVVAFP